MLLNPPKEKIRPPQKRGVVNGGKLRVSGLRVPDMKKTRKNGQGKPARKKPLESTSSSTSNDAFEQGVQLVYEKALSNYEQAKKERLKLKKPSLAAIRAALKLHAVPLVEVDKLVLEADRTFRTAVDSLKGAGDGQAMDHIVNAVTGWVELLRELFVEPPEACKEAAAKIIRTRLTFPINFAGSTTYAKSAYSWLNDHGFQQGCLDELPRERANKHTEIFRQFASLVVRRLSHLRSELELRTPDADFEKAIASLPVRPDRAWRDCFIAAPAALFGDDWALERPDLETFRRSFDGCLIPLHTPEIKWPPMNTRLNNKAHRATAMKAHASHLLKDFAKVRFSAKKGNSKWQFPLRNTLISM